VTTDDDPDAVLYVVERIEDGELTFTRNTEHRVHAVDEEAID